VVAVAELMQKSVVGSKNIVYATQYSQLWMLYNGSYDRQQYLTASRRCMKYRNETAAVMGQTKGSSR